MAEWFGAVLTVLSTAFLTGMGLNLVVRRTRRFGQTVAFGEINPVEVRRRRIARLQRSLRESMDLLNELDRDITTGQKQVDELQQQITRDAEVAKLTQEQADAMRSLLSEVVGANLGRSERRTFWQQFGLGLLFFGLGVGVTLLLG